jgi:hypothetical protein
LTVNYSGTVTGATYTAFALTNATTAPLATATSGIESKTVVATRRDGTITFDEGIKSFIRGSTGPGFIRVSIRLGSTGPIVTAVCNVIPGFGVTQSGYSPTTVPPAASLVVTPIRITTPHSTGPNTLRFSVNNKSTAPIICHFVGYLYENSPEYLAYNLPFQTTRDFIDATQIWDALSVTNTTFTNGVYNPAGTGWTGVTFAFPDARTAVTRILPNQTGLMGTFWNLPKWPGVTSASTYLYVTDEAGATGTIAFTSAPARYISNIDKIVTTVPPAPATETYALTYPSSKTVQLVVNNPPPLPFYSGTTSLFDRVFTLKFVSGTDVITITDTVSNSPIPKIGTSATILFKITGNPAITTGKVFDVYVLLFGAVVKVLPAAATWHGASFGFIRPTVQPPIMITSPLVITDGVTELNIGDAINTLLSQGSTGSKDIGDTGGSADLALIKTTLTTGDTLPTGTYGPITIAQAIGEMHANIREYGTKFLDLQTLVQRVVTKLNA